MPVAAVPPQVEELPPAANPQVPDAANLQGPDAANPQGLLAANLQVPLAANPEVPGTAAVPNAQSNPPVTVHRQLLSRLVRALPIGFESQLQVMLDVFDPIGPPRPRDTDFQPTPI